MSEQYLGEIRIMAFNYAPRGWAQANGQILPINQNQALFALLGTTYGGNGIQDFALPNLQSRIPVSLGTGPFGDTFSMGQTGGEESHMLISSEMPLHGHGTVQATSTSSGTTATALGNVLAGAGNVYISGNSAPVVLAASAVSTVGNNQSHPNIQPFQALNFCIALVGIFPSRN